MKQKRTGRPASRRVHDTRTLKKQAGKSVSKGTAAGKENREHKDSVFVDLFYEDETAEKNLSKGRSTSVLPGGSWQSI